MLFTTKMKQLVAVVLDKDMEQITRELLNQSLLHFVNIREVSREWKDRLHSVEPQVSRAVLGELRGRVESFLGIINLQPSSGEELDIQKMHPVDLTEAKKFLDKIAEKLQGVRERQRLIQQEILKFEDIKRQLGLFGNLGAGLKANSRYSFLSIQTGSIRTSLLKNFESALNTLPTVNLNFQEEDNQTHILLISMKKDETRINGILEQFGWVDIDISQNIEGLQDGVDTDLERKLTKMKEEQEELAAHSDNLVKENRDTLLQMWENLRMNELFYKVQSYFSKTSRTVIFSGWLPEASQKTLEKALLRITGGTCYLQWNDPAPGEDAEGHTQKVPVKMENPRFLAPFQMLVKNFSIPEYGTVDPTFFVAVAYLMMFGLMFGDVGQGVVLVLCGLLGTQLFKGKGEGMRNLAKLIVWCGGAAIVAGVLFGSYFGFSWFPPLWFDYHGIIAGHVPHAGPVKNVYGILKITIYFGIFIIGTGLLLNWINLIAKRKWFNLVFDKGGILGVWMYAAGVYTAFYFVGSDYNAFPAGNALFWMFGLPALLFTLKPPLEFIIHKKLHPGKKFTPLTPVDFLMEWIVEMLEVFSGYLANTLSFMRVAGLGIAHASLMIAFYEIAATVNGGQTDNFGVGAYIILVIGNILVIALEGLSAGIQSLRLNYYEFFSKYFSGSGEAYAPVSLHNRS